MQGFQAFPAFPAVSESLPNSPSHSLYLCLPRSGWASTRLRTRPCGSRGSWCTTRPSPSDRHLPSLHPFLTDSPPLRDSDPFAWTICPTSRLRCCTPSGPWAARACRRWWSGWTRTAWTATTCWTRSGTCSSSSPGTRSSQVRVCRTGLRFIFIILILLLPVDRFEGLDGKVKAALTRAYNRCAPCPSRLSLTSGLPQLGAPLASAHLRAGAEAAGQEGRRKWRCTGPSLPPLPSLSLSVSLHYLSITLSFFTVTFSKSFYVSLALLLSCASISLHYLSISHTLCLHYLSSPSPRWRSCVRLQRGGLPLRKRRPICELVILSPLSSLLTSASQDSVEEGSDKGEEEAAPAKGTDLKGIAAHGRAKKATSAVAVKPKAPPKGKKAAAK